MQAAPPEDLARLAIDGDRDALEELIKALQGRRVRSGSPHAVGTPRTPRMRHRRFSFARSPGCRNSTFAAGSRRGCTGSRSTRSST